MKQNLKQLTIGFALASSLLMSCTKENNTEKVVDRVHVTSDDSMSAEELSTAAEQLVSPYTFMLAYKTALKALEKDPTNIKAQFYVSFLKRFEAFRGIVTRIKPLLKPEDAKNWDEYLKKYSPNSPLKTFLLDNSKPELKNAVDVQNVVSEYISALKDFRKFLKEHQSSEMNIYLNPHVFEQAIQNEIKDSCTFLQDGDKWSVDCDYTMAATKKLNMADMIALTQMQAGEILLYGLYNSYSLEGIEKLQDADPQGKMSNREKTNFLSSLPNFGKLRKDHIFDLLTSIGSDFSAAAKWAVTYQNNLCPKGYGIEKQRRGYLFSNGICIEHVSELENALATLDSALQGIIQIDLKRPNGEVVNSNVNAFTWSKAPIQDLRQIKPTTWNNCDRALSLADNTLGGVLVDNNAGLFLDPTCQNTRSNSK